MTYIDPIQASPDEYKLLLDGDKARVVEMRLPAGTIDTEMIAIKRQLIILIDHSTTANNQICMGSI